MAISVGDALLKVGVDTREAVSNLESFGKKVQNIGQSLSKASTPFLIAGTAIVGALGLCVKAAAESEKSQARLVSALKATNQYSAEQEMAMSKLSTQMQHLTGVSDEAYTEAQAFGLQLGLTADQTMKLIPHIADLSASTGVDMETAMRAAAMATEGNVGMLKRYGIEIKVNADKTVDFNNVLDGFAGFAGAAEAKGKTLQGQMAIVKETFGDLAEKVGNVLIPIIKNFIDKYIKPLIERLQALNPQVVENGVKFVAMAGAILMTIGVVGKLIGLISGLGSLFTPTGLILAGIGAFIFLIVQIVKHWDEIKVAMTGFYDKWIKPWLDPFIKGLEWIVNLVEKIVNWFKKGMGNMTVNVVGAGEALGGHFQTGGIVTRPTIAMIGERGPEAVIPLNQMSNDESLRIQKDMLRELIKFNEITSKRIARDISLGVSGLGQKA
jgi:uncharacterized coiled-coil protein SlyX